MEVIMMAKQNKVEKEYKKYVVYDENTAVIAIITEDKRMVGIVVDKVDDVQKIDTNALSPVSDMGSAMIFEYLKGFLRMENNEMLVVMDIHFLL